MISFIMVSSSEIVVQITDDGDRNSARTSRFVARLKPFVIGASAADVPKRILVSLCPPLMFGFARRNHFDLLGPAISILLLGAVFCGLLISHANYTPILAFFETCAVIFTYPIFMSAILFVLTRAFSSALKFLQVFSLVGYGAFSHSLVLLFSVAVFSKPIAPFLVCLSIFGGAGAFRISLVLMLRTRLAVGRFLVCTAAATLHLLYAVFLFFKYFETAAKM